MLLGRKQKGLEIMSFIFDFIKNIFCTTPQTGLVGLSGFKTVKKVQSSKTMNKKSEPKLSDLMKKSHKQLKV